jgi:pimeloyl-ACP methyl ester carboxylesterase
MPHVSANGITLAYQTSGERSEKALLLIMGLGGQLIAWDEEFVAALVGRGFFVVRFDNRDVGLSSWFDDAGTPDILGAMTGQGQAPYRLADMADDAAGLLDALGLPAAHLLGVSMGGMIAQTMAIEHPEQVLSLVSIMSTTGDPAVGAPHPEAVTALLRPPAADRDGSMDQAVEVWKAIGSPGFPFHEDRVRAQAAAAYDRAFHPDGTGRQMVAILSSGDRTEGLRRLSCPTLVVHGDGDPLVDPSGGRATAAAVPGAELMIVAGMGHHLPPEIFDELADRVAAQATSTPSST